jgi:hypothetical protein
LSLSALIQTARKVSTVGRFAVFCLPDGPVRKILSSPEQTR